MVKNAKFTLLVPNVSNVLSMNNFPFINGGQSILFSEFRRNVIKVV